VNVFGVLDLATAIRNPLLERQRWGALVHALRVHPGNVYPFNSTYSATKHAALAVTEGLRIQLESQWHTVIVLYAGFHRDSMETRCLTREDSARTGGGKTMEAHSPRIDSSVSDEPRSGCGKSHATRISPAPRRHAGAVDRLTGV